MEELEEAEVSAVQKEVATFSIYLPSYLTIYLPAYLLVSIPTYIPTYLQRWEKLLKKHGHNLEPGKLAQKYVRKMLKTVQK